MNKMCGVKNQFIILYNSSIIKFKTTNIQIPVSKNDI